MWLYKSSGPTNSLTNKNGNWKYLEEHWTLPVKEETEEMIIESIDGRVLELIDTNEVVLQREFTLNSSHTQIWTRNLAANGFCTFSMQVNESRKFLTADGKLNLTIKGRNLSIIQFCSIFIFLYIAS